MPRPRRSTAARELSAITRILKDLVRRLDRLGRTVGTETGPKRGRLRRPLSPKARAALKLQGQYMGYVRQLTPKQKAEVRAVKEKQGVVAAIRRAKELAKKAA